MLQQKPREFDSAISSGFLYMAFFAKNSMPYKIAGHLHSPGWLAEEVDTRYRLYQSGYKSSLKDS
jgi:hypothetical protein